MSRHHPGRRLAHCAGIAISLLIVGACADDPSTIPAHHSHVDPLLSASAAPEVQRKIVELRRWSETFHTLEGAAAAGYTLNIGCIDETVTGVTPQVARGMGYHVTLQRDIVGDGIINIDEPEFLVYAPHERDAQLDRDQRLGAARLVGFDYFVPGAAWAAKGNTEPPEFFGEPFTWSATFQGWMRHIYLWGHNPEGIFEDFNGQVRLCTEILTP